MFFRHILIPSAVGSGGNSGGGLDLADTTVPEDTEIYHIYIVIYKGIKWIFYTFTHLNTCTLKIFLQMDMRLCAQTFQHTVLVSWKESWKNSIRFPWNDTCLHCCILIRHHLITKFGAYQKWPPVEVASEKDLFLFLLLRL